MTPTTTILPPDEVNEVMVKQLVRAMGAGMQTAVVPGVTTETDILTAVFTVLTNMLRVVSTGEGTLQEHAHNTQEIRRVLSGLLLEFGTPDTRN